MIPLTAVAKKTALNFLTEDVSNTADLAKKLGCDLGEAEAVEIALVADTLLSRSPGFYANPRFFLTDNGLVFLALVDAKAPMAPQDILTAIKAKPSGGFYAGSRLQVYHACMTLVALGLVQTGDGGGTFSLAE